MLRVTHSLLFRDFSLFENSDASYYDRVPLHCPKYSALSVDIMAAESSLPASPSIEVLDSSLTITDAIHQKIVDLEKEGSDDSFYVANLSDVAAKHAKWTSLLPRVQPFYAVKCLNDAVILRLLAALGTGFDCASQQEIADVLSLGVSPDRIVYANTCKQFGMLAYARDAGVDLLTFDNEEELRKVKAVAPNSRLLLRILPPRTEKVMTSLADKFGCPLRRVRPLLAEASTLGLQVVGLSFHVGSGCYDAVAFANAVVTAAAAAAIAEEVGFNISILDIGGGFPGATNAPITLEEIAAVLVPALDKHFPPSSGVRLIAEPGRYFVASALQLTTKVIGKRLDYSDDSNDIDSEPSPDAVRSADAAVVKSCTLSRVLPQPQPQASGATAAEEAVSDPSRASYYINEGFYNSFLCAVLGRRTRPPHLIPSPASDAPSLLQRRTLRSIVYGNTCDGTDVLLEGVPLKEAFVGDWMSFVNMGSYSIAVSTSFNGMPRPRLYYVAYEVITF